MLSHFIIAGEEFPLVKRIVCIGERDFPLALVPNESAQLERIIKIRGFHERVWPYWLEEWPATIALAEALEKEDPSLWVGPILDLGCGSGFLSVYLFLRYGLKPFSCDFNADACRLTGLNLQGACLGLDPNPFPQRAFCADLASAPFRATFGLIVAGDLLYSQENHGPILSFLKTHMSPSGIAFFADPGRASAEGFSAQAAVAGFEVGTRETQNPNHAGKQHVYKLRFRDHG